MGLSIRKRKKPCAHNLGLSNVFVMDKTSKIITIGRVQDAGRMIGKAGQDSHIVPVLGPVLREFRDARGGSAHLGWKILRYVEYFHISNNKA